MRVHAAESNIQLAASINASKCKILELALLNTMEKKYSLLALACSHPTSKSFIYT